MFNLNESNHILISNTPTGMRVGVDTMCGKVRQAGLIPTDGSVYVFVGKTRKVMKLLERGSYAMYYKQLEQGRLSPRLSPSGSQVGFREIQWDELVLYIEGISPKTKRRLRFQCGETKGKLIMDGMEKWMWNTHKTTPSDLWGRP